MTRSDVDLLADHVMAVSNPKLPPALLHDKVAESAVLIGLAGCISDAQEIVEPLLGEIRNRILEHRLMAEAEGVAWNVELYGSDDEWIRGASFQDKSLDPLELGVRARRAHSDSVLIELQRLSAVEFERACTEVISRLGCANPYTSPIRDDGGIDFYGQLALKGRLQTPLPLGGIDSRANVWLIGQAKHYPTRAVGPEVVRELVGSVELARTSGAIHSWKGLELRPFDATVLLVFTTGRFSSGSLKLLARSGVLAMSGKQLSTFLCDAGLGFVENSPSFDPDQFRNELLDSGKSV